jgi:hypothetical protein
VVDYVCPSPGYKEIVGIDRKLMMDPFSPMRQTSEGNEFHGALFANDKILVFSSWEQTPMFVYNDTSRYEE